MADSGEMLAYPQRLHHEPPGWAKRGSLFHVRLRVASEQVVPLTEPKLATRLLSAARNYHERGLWHCALLVIMTDHVHALLAFPIDASMRKTVGAWKRYAAREFGVSWQLNFFDHRIRNEAERLESWSYIARNPVAKKLCEYEHDWPWVWKP
jgi:putative transposase